MATVFGQERGDGGGCNNNNVRSALQNTKKSADHSEQKAWNADI
jgi:hypothetical protein